MRPRPAEVVIVGGGVVGASVAWHLAARGCRDVVVLERGAAPGQGSTGRATGGFRAQFGSEVNVRLSLLSREKLLRFPDELGVDPGYRPCGYLFLAEEERTLEVLRAARAVQHAAGLPEARPVTREEAREINPWVRMDGVAGGAFCPSDGFLRPLEILRGYTEGARRLGVRFAYGTPVLGLPTEGARITAVRTPEGEIATERVVNAAGAWAAEVGRLAGVELPVVPLKRQAAATPPGVPLPEEMPMTIFAEDGFHLRVRDGRALLLRPAPPRAPDPFDTSVEEGWVKEITRATRARVPALAGVPVDRAHCWAGLYELSPDRYALLGRAPGVENLFLANGSSGHGVMHAPALGHLLAEILLDGGARTVDVRALRPERFREGEPNPAPVLL
jgi:sarcosine oxidase subunit beta